MGFQAVSELAGKSAGIGGPAHRFRGLAGNSDMVGVAVQASRLEGQHHLGPETAYLFNQLLHHFLVGDVDVGVGVSVGLGTGHPRVPIAQYPVARQAQGLDRAGQLNPADGAQGLPGSGAVLPDLPLFS